MPAQGEIFGSQPTNEFQGRKKHDLFNCELVPSRVPFLGRAPVRVQGAAPQQSQLASPFHANHSQGWKCDWRASATALRLSRRTRPR